MIFNFWKPYPMIRPKKDGRYLCTVTDNRRRVIELYYCTHNEGSWIDIRRQRVFDGYKVYKQCREPMDYNRVFTDGLCERKDVIAWKKLPNACWWMMEHP